jgi:hypothetical protein
MEKLEVMGMSNSVLVDDPSLMLGRSLQEVSDLLELELNSKIRDGGVPLTGLVLDGVSDDGKPVRLEVRLSIRSEEE